MSYITAISTALPDNGYNQENIMRFYENASDNETSKRKIRAVFKKSQIHTRYSVIKDYGLEPEFFTFFPRNKSLEPLPSYDDKMTMYKHHALNLSLKAIWGIKNFNKIKKTITHIITVSCTGLYAPGLEIDLIEKLGLNKKIERIGINFLGCNAAIPALKYAHHICRSVASAKVLVVCTELCTIHFDKDFSDDYLLSTSLFGDGSACLLVESDQAASRKRALLKIKSFSSLLINDTKDEMAWDITNRGFRMKLKASVATHIKQNLNSYLNGSSFTINDATQFAAHPGGKKILDEIVKVKGFTHGELNVSYKILNQYGNMSSATILFVLKELLEQSPAQKKGNIILFSFGPGLTIEGCDCEYV